MNIFVTNSCPTKSAQYLDDKRVIKMILESAQMLSTALNEKGCAGPYKSTHINHPCNIWVRQSQGNYIWLLKHFIALCKEYTARYGKTHKCEQYKDWFMSSGGFIPAGNLTPFVNCAANKELGISYKDETNVHTAYKLYLKDRWNNDKRKPTWYKKERC